MPCQPPLSSGVECQTRRTCLNTVGRKIRKKEWKNSQKKAVIGHRSILLVFLTHLTTMPSYFTCPNLCTISSLQSSPGEGNCGQGGWDLIEFSLLFFSARVSYFSPHSYFSGELMRLFPPNHEMLTGRGVRTGTGFGWTSHLIPFSGRFSFNSPPVHVFWKCTNFSSDFVLDAKRRKSVSQVKTKVSVSQGSTTRKLAPSNKLSGHICTCCTAFSGRLNWSIRTTINRSFWEDWLLFIGSMTYCADGPASRWPLAISIQENEERSFSFYWLFPFYFQLP